MRERLTRTGDRIQLRREARIKIGCWELGLSTGGLGCPPVAGSQGAQNGG